MVQAGETITYTWSGGDDDGKHVLDISSIGEITIDYIDGAGGTGTAGSAGGRVENVTANVSNHDTLYVWVAGGDGSNTTELGRYQGGQEGYMGGGSSEVSVVNTDDSDSETEPFIAAAGGGGGGYSSNQFIGATRGGGGARGGSGSDSNSEDGNGQAPPLGGDAAIDGGASESGDGAISGHGSSVSTSGGTTIKGGGSSNETGGEIQITYKAGVSPPSAPQNVSASYIADDQIDFSFDAPPDWGGEEGSYDVEILRDNGSWKNPSGGPTSPSSAGTYSYGPNSDTAYGRQVGVDSSFEFRVRATNSAGSSSWGVSSTIYTTPTPPHSPNTSRPSSSEIDHNWTVESDIESGTEIQYREDTGSGYGVWTTLRTTGPSVIGYVETGLPEDVRRQYRYRHVVGSENASEWVYADYGNEGNIYFEDSFDSGNLDKWDETTTNDARSQVVSDSSARDSISYPDTGSQYLRLDASDSVTKNLGDLSTETDVIVRATIGVEGLDDSGDWIHPRWYDGNSWNTLRDFSTAYNLNGWVQFTAKIPDSNLSTNNKLQFLCASQGGNYHYIDSVVVSDILHEYTNPTAPSGLSLDTSVADEISLSWNNNNPFGDYYQFQWRVAGSGDSWTTESASQTTATHTGVDDGEKYEYLTEVTVQQARRGSNNNSYHAESSIQEAISLLPAPTINSIE
ncbi:fibronectin type III domain-containing protein [Halosegnis longus]|uniref:fibronectin type III domain-containing protein n=1 Tax=Halosegnis longus TaxID=2216012 RepID=UPI00129EDE74|nr:fibronectin type III domain-containing protein [Halosegnis longus]